MGQDRNSLNGYHHMVQSMYISRLRAHPNVSGVVTVPSLTSLLNHFRALKSSNRTEIYKKGLEYIESNFINDPDADPVVVLDDPEEYDDDYLQEDQNIGTTLVLDLIEEEEALPGSANLERMGTKPQTVGTNKTVENTLEVDQKSDKIPKDSNDTLVNGTSKLASNATSNSTKSANTTKNANGTSKSNKTKTKSPVLKLTHSKTQDKDPEIEQQVYSPQNISSSMDPSSAQTTTLTLYCLLILIIPIQFL
jgi:hypothetical protein